VTFQFQSARSRRSVTCEETYTWAMQAKGSRFVVTPSYANNANCTYNGVMAEIIVGATCRYQFEQPYIELGLYRTTQSITPAGCEIRIRTEAGACEVVIRNEAMNEGLRRVSLSNVVPNLRIIPVVFPIRYTASAGCRDPIAPPADSILSYMSEQDVANARVVN